MFPILVLLLFLPPSSGTTIQTLSSDCRIGQKAECEKAIFVPGHSLLGQGVNIVTMEKTRSYLINMEEYINPQQTCKLCRNPHTNEWNKVPKSMVNWIPINSYKASVISKTDDSVVSLAKEESSSVQNDWSGGLSIKYKALSYDTVVAGSNSKVTQFAESKSRTNKYKFIRQQVESSLYSFQIARKYSLNSHFFDEVKNLPKTYNRSTEQRYMSFIQEFGTHYISKAEIGGRGLEVIAVKVCEVEMKGMDMEEVKSCLSFESKASVEGNTSGSIQAKLKECEQSAKKYNYGASYHKSFNERFSKVREY
uniref:MACPF domain-containing protein n=1 Tax=Leptobrachium leishanense TaxID=445787 RepID=A0A8C5QJS4_9ANUR